MFHSIATSCSSPRPPRSSAARLVTVFAIAHLFAEKAADTLGAAPGASLNSRVPMAAPEAIPHAEMVRARRHLHASPELSMVEFDTARFVAETLATYGLDEIRTKVGKTGVLGTLTGGRP